MSRPVYLNEEEIFARFKAKLLDYSVGAVSISDSYLARKNSIIPVKLKESIGTRPITLELEFEGDSCHESLLNISNLTAELLMENDILLPDGFYYYCVLDNVGTPKLEGHTYYTVQFTLVGYRHLSMLKETFTETDGMFVAGNMETPAIITIEGATGTVTVNGITVKDIKQTVVINGYDKTVMETDGAVESNKFKDCTMIKFPSLVPGYNLIDIDGTATVTIEYTPIFM
jgi:phage-related protein